MRNTFFFLFFFFLLHASAQSITIHWNGAKLHDRGEGYSAIFPYFSNDGYSVINNIPRFSYAKETTGYGNVELQDIQYDNLSANERGSLNIREIPSTLNYTVKVNQAGDLYYISVSMIPFVKEGNQIKKVSSFRISNSNTSGKLIEGQGTLDPATQSVLREGNWYKIRVNKSGIFRLDKSFFDQNGIPTNFDPRTLKVYGNGGRMLSQNPGDFRYGALQENAIQFYGQDDGSFDNSDFVLFYAQGPHTWNRYKTSTLENLTHRTNDFTDYAYYFITYGGEQGKRVQNLSIDGNPVQTFNQFHEYQFHEKDSISLNQVGRQWMGESFTLEPTQNITINGNANSAGPFYSKYKLVGKDAQGVNYSANLNGIALGSNTFGSGTFYDYVGNNSNNLTGSSFTFTFSVTDSGNPSAFVFIDYVEIKYVANLLFNGTQMQFRRLEDLNDGNVYGFAVSNVQNVWNISDITNAQNVVNSGGIYKYRATSSNLFLNEFIAFNESAAFTEVEYVGTVANQNIRALKNIDYVIVTHPNFITEASRLANFRQTESGVKVALVTTDQVYNEFSSGAQDLSAIRDFFKHLRDSGSALNYAVLFGGASYDYKDRIIDNTNFVPTYISFNSSELGNSFATDDYFSMLDDSDVIMAAADPGEYSESSVSSQMDISVGRFPAHNAAEAKVMVDKTLAYYEKLPNQGTSFGDWKTKFLLVVDDDEGTGGVPFHETIEDSSGQFIQNNITYATLRKGYADAFVQQGTSAGPRYPQVNEIIANSFNLGTALIVYFGHGGPRSWAQERIITYEEISSFSNFTGLYSRLPVVITITCEFTVWDVPNMPAAGVYMFKATEGGSVAMATTSRPVGVYYGENFNEFIVEESLELQGTQYQSMGNALRFAKIAYPNSYNLSVNLLGDPMLSISRPQRQIRITKINGEDADVFSGVLQAMDFVEIEGEVLDETGSMRDNSFNGKANATLFDKPVNKVTLNNDGELGVMNFQEQINAIFKGGTNVNYGQFKFQFYVPKDINYEVGDGKLTVYAHNNVVDGVTIKNIQIGGQNENGFDDDEGPAIGLYMNNLNFVNGGITNRNPYLLACLVDSIGINTSGIAIGHDLTGVLDDNVEGTYVLNEYYEGGDNNPCTNPEVLDYQKGQVMYRLNNLALGNHQIRFKAWDINNNSSEETLDFVVMEEGSDHIYIDKLLNWPNPFTNQTFFHFEHNCDTELEVMVQIFTISGKIVKTIRQTVSAEPWREGYRTGRFAIPWDGLDDFGDKIGKGVYIYRVTARGVNPDLCKGSATAIEKLVILK